MFFLFWCAMNKVNDVMDTIKDFKKSLEGLKASTLRVYLAGAKTAINAVKADVSQCRSHAELLALIREAQPEKRARIEPFLRFLERNSGGSKNTSVPLEDMRGIQYWVVQALAKRLRREKNPSIASRRDMALLACLCVAPAKGKSRNWPRNCLRIDGDTVILWDKRVEEPAFRLALRFWHSWRERLARPDQRRLYRKAPQWSHSKLLFPGPRGEPLSRAALHNALRRLLGGAGEGSLGRPITPKTIRFAFLAGDTLGPGGAGSRKRPDTCAPL
jgi:hypothetical protein